MLHITVRGGDRSCKAQAAGIDEFTAQNRQELKARRESDAFEQAKSKEGEGDRERSSMMEFY